MGQPCVVLLPVKAPSLGKSRLVGISESDRARLSLAFVTDALTACWGSTLVHQVAVVTDDPGVAHLAESTNALVLPDHDDGLNAALQQAASRLRTVYPSLRPTALLADVPALRSVELSAALADLPAGPAFVADADGTGSTLYSASYDDFDPRFGPDSARAHAAAGARPVVGDLLGLRRDVDDVTSLRAADEIGLGSATRRAYPDSLK